MDEFERNRQITENELRRLEAMEIDRDAHKLYKEVTKEDAPKGVTFDANDLKWFLGVLSSRGVTEDYLKKFYWCFRK